MTTFEQVYNRLRLAQVQGMYLSDEERDQLDTEIDGILKSIAGITRLDDADKELQELGVIQTLLATLCFVYKIELSKKQRELVRRYDRWDDVQERAVSFDAIRKGEFP